MPRDAAARNASCSLPPSYSVTLRSTRENGKSCCLPSTLPNWRGRAFTEDWHVDCTARTVAFIHSATRCLKTFGSRAKMRNSSCCNMHISHTRMCGCNEPRPCASISPRKARTGPTMPSAADDAATPSVHHSRGPDTFTRRRPCTHSGRTPSKWTKNSRMMSSNTRVCPTGSRARRCIMSRYRGKSTPARSASSRRISMP